MRTGNEKEGTSADPKPHLLLATHILQHGTLDCFISRSLIDFVLSLQMHAAFQPAAVQRNVTGEKVNGAAREMARTVRS
jgi:hypothetical protein